MLSAVILAGGLGTRLRDVVPNLPKPMAPINGKPFLEYQLDYWITQGINNFILSVGYRYEEIINHFGNRYKGATFDYVIEKTPLGTGGGLLLCLEKVKQTSFLLLNGDTYFDVNLKTLTEFALKNNSDWCFSLFRTNEEAQGRYMGLDISSTGQIVSLKSESNLINGGVYWVNRRALMNPQFIQGNVFSLENNIFPSAITFGQRLFGIEFKKTFIDIGLPDDYYRASKLLQFEKTIS